MLHPVKNQIDLILRRLMLLWVHKHSFHFIFFILCLVTILVPSAVGKIFPAGQIRNVSAETISTCLDRVNIDLNELHWIYVPESADELRTSEDRFFLAGQLIANNIVNASACPSGGLTLDGYANACGIAMARPAVNYIQNMLNESILQAYKDIGVPPVLLKQLITVESEFWPAEYVKHGYAHHGFGHITNMGMLNGLQWNPSLAAQVCPTSAIEDCRTSVSIADEILTSLNATCPTCKYGIDPEMANHSVDILADVVFGYCLQTARVIYNATERHSSQIVDYATMWKLTLMNYNAGPFCVYDAVLATFKKTQGRMDWSQISSNVSGDLCIRGLTYANQVTTKVFNFPPLK
jgi:hypothetical protein